MDIDECANDPTLCENGHCTNTPGGYYCDCDVGFTKTPDERSCLGNVRIYSLVQWWQSDGVRQMAYCWIEHQLQHICCSVRSIFILTYLPNKK